VQSEQTGEQVYKQFSRAVANREGTRGETASVRSSGDDGGNTAQAGATFYHLLDQARRAGSEGQYVKCRAGRKKGIANEAKTGPN